MAPTVKTAIAKRFVECLEFDWNSDDFMYATLVVFETSPANDRTLRDPCLCTIQKNKSKLCKRSSLHDLLTNSHEFAEEFAKLLVGTDDVVAEGRHFFCIHCQTLIRSEDFLNSCPQCRIGRGGLKTVLQRMNA